MVIMRPDPTGRPHPDLRPEETARPDEGPQRKDQEVSSLSREAPAGIGGMLTRARVERGWSQLRLAELLCAVAGAATVTRHEVSRWEREERVPSGYWLGWLADALGTPVTALEAAAGRTRAARTAVRAEGRGLANPGWSSSADASGSAPQGMALALGSKSQAGGTSAGLDLAAFDARVAALRRMDDLVGGADLAKIVMVELRSALAGLGGVTGSTATIGPAALAPRLVAQLAQVACWVLADAGDPVMSARAARAGLRLAARSSDRPLVAHLLGCLSEIATEGGDGERGLRLARAASARAAPGPRLGRALQLHRLAYAAAIAGRREEATAALDAAEGTVARPGREGAPPWLYWLDDRHLAVLAGRCHAALGNARPAERLLTEAIAGGGLTPRARAICGAWLGISRATSGDLDGACDVAGYALLAAVRSGSVRAARRVRALDAALTAHPDPGSAVGRYVALADRTIPYLPDARSAGKADAAWTVADRRAGSPRSRPATG